MPINEELLEHRLRAADSERKAIRETLNEFDARIDKIDVGVAKILTTLEQAQKPGVVVGSLSGIIAGAVAGVLSALGLKQ